MAERITVKPELLKWAIARSGKDFDQLAESKRFAQLPTWLDGSGAPTLKQLEAFAKATYTPFGYFFLPEPIEEPLPVPDFRTMGGGAPGRPSANLLDMLYVCQQRQDWYQGFARSMGEEPLRFVESATLDSDIVETAARMRRELNFPLDAQCKASTWTDALRAFITAADEAGVLVMCSGVVLSNNNRPLDPEEFRGFALADRLAPVVFVNGADTKAGQMFTLAHELAHIWLGQSGVSDTSPGRESEQAVERWCNRVAAELLVPAALFLAEYRPGEPLRSELDRLARRFKVSTLVILRRIHDVGAMSETELWKAYEAELAYILEKKASSGGGDFYLSTAARVSKRFARALVVSTWEGRSSFSEAFQLLGIRKTETFRGLADRLGMAV